jgi:hypothetical protein
MIDWRRIGSVIVDSASLWIGDPAYPPRPGHSMSDTCGDARYCDRKDWPNNGVSFFTFDGDGTYTVYAEFSEDGAIMRVMVDMTIQDGEETPLAGDTPPPDPPPARPTND